MKISMIEISTNISMSMIKILFLIESCISMSIKLCIYSYKINIEIRMPRTFLKENYFYSFNS